MTRPTPGVCLTLLIAVLPLAAGCSRTQLGLPQVALAVDSPDGGYRAVVRNHPSIDPPRQSLWLERVGGGRQWLHDLATDQDWCDQAVWTPDGRRVAFVVQGIELLVYAVPEGELLQRSDLRTDGAYPPSLHVAGLRFTADGAALDFRLCSRRGDRCAEPARLAVAGPSGAS